MSPDMTNAALAVAAACFDGIWEGALILGAVWLALRCAPALGAATRYAVWMCALAAMVLTPVATVYLSASHAAPVTASARTADPVPAAAAAAAAETAGSAHGAATGSGSHANGAGTPGAIRAGGVGGRIRAVGGRIRAVGGRTPAAGASALSEPARTMSELVPAASRQPRITISRDLAVVVALVWLLCVCGRGLLLLADLRKLAALRRDARPWATAHAHPVFLSDRVDVPLAAGFRHAAIILPAALVDELAPDAVEAIVVHELAHLRRYDVWTNAFARVAEVVLALNPAAWFVMRRLATEREIACDDWVVARTGAGDAFAHTLAALASRARSRVPIAAASAFGSRHSVVVRIERLLDARPRRLRLSPPALGGALMLLASIAFVMQTVSPVLAYAPQPAVVAQASEAPAAGSCPVPNRGIVLAYLLGPKRRTARTPADNVPVLPASEVASRAHGAHLATFDLTVDAAGKPRKVTVISPRDPKMAQALQQIYMASTFEPALHDCVPVETTIRTAVPVQPPERTTGSVIIPVYPVGWSKQHASACKVPTITRGRFRSGFAAPTPYTAMLPKFPDSEKNVPLGFEAKTSVRVHVNPAGTATSAKLVSSSGRSDFDEAALVAARAAKYPLGPTTCTPLPTEYVWNTTFEYSSMLFRLAVTAAKSP
jgi:TonB family protein